MRYVALLRGVNVGGHRRVPMGDLRLLLEQLGHADVATYLQSGNALFSTDAGDEDVLAQQVHGVLLDRLGVDTTVMVRSAAELATVVEGNPWPARVTEPKKLHVAYLSAVPDDVPDLARFAPDEVAVVGRAAYLWYDDAAGRSRLTLDALERALAVTGTARNWTTVTTLARLAAGPATG